MIRRALFLLSAVAFAAAWIAADAWVASAFPATVIQSIPPAAVGKH